MAEMEPPRRAPTPRLGLSKVTPRRATFGAAEVRSWGLGFAWDEGTSRESARSVVVMVLGMVLESFLKSSQKDAASSIKVRGDAPYVERRKRAEGWLVKLNDLF